MSFPEHIQDACGVVLVAETDARPSSRVLPLTLDALGRLAHRGGVDADGRTGDGAGILTQIPFEIFQSELGGLACRNVAVGMFFLPTARGEGIRARRIAAECIAAHELLAVRWRAVPIEAGILGRKALSCVPLIEQLFVIPRISMSAGEFETRLFRARTDMESS